LHHKAPNPAGTQEYITSARPYPLNVRKMGLVMLDLHLPDIGGEEVLRRLQADPKTAHLPVVVLSADTTPGQIQRLLAAGASQYLTKPLDVTRFLEVVDQLLQAAHR
jgi:CheY-like chemotaxis protein